VLFICEDQLDAMPQERKKALDALGISQQRHREARLAKIELETIQVKISELSQ